MARFFLCLTAMLFLGFVTCVMLVGQAATGAFTRLPSPKERRAEFEKYRPALEHFVHGDTVLHAKKNSVSAPEELHSISTTARVYGKPGHRQVEFTVRSTFGWGQYYFWREDDKPPTHLHDRALKDYYHYTMSSWGDGWYDVYMNNGH